MNSNTYVKNVFDFLNDLSHDKSYKFGEATKSVYEPFIINRGMSQHIDTLMLANEMNKNSHIDKLLQHDFYFHVVSKKKRYGKWAKAKLEHEDDVAFIARHYNVNKIRAREYYDLLTDDELNYLKKTYDFGGYTK